jgi:ribosomal protein L11
MSNLVEYSDQGGSQNGSRWNQQVAAGNLTFHQLCDIVQKKDNKLRVNGFESIENSSMNDTRNNNHI